MLLEEGLVTDKEKRKNNNLIKPINPQILGWLTLVLTPIITSLLLAFNWRRFNKSYSWVLVTLFVWITVPILIFLIAVVIATFAESTGANILLWARITFIIAAFGFFCGFFFPMMIAGRQNVIYHRMKEDNTLLESEHSYDWEHGIAIWSSVALIFSILFGLLGYSDPYRPTSNGRIEVTVPFGWGLNNEEDLRYCRLGFNECHLTASTSNNSLLVIFAEYNARNGDNSPQIATEFSLERVTKSSDFRFVTRETLMIGSNTAFMIVYEKDDMQFFEIFMQRNSTNLFVFIESRYERLLDNNWDDIIDMLHSVVVFPQ